MEIIKTQMGGKKLLHEGYAYVIDKVINERIYWKCEKRHYCNGRVITHGEIICKATEHSHQQDSAHIDAIKVIDKIKINSQHSEEIPSSIINQCTNDVPVSIVGKLPRKESLARTIRRVRNSTFSGENLTVTTRGEPFLLFDENGVKIYAATQNVNTLKSHRRWLCDGTFKSAPNGKQLYTIHGLIDQNMTLPLVYCITNNKDETTYSIIFEFLHENQLNPVSTTADFERSAINQMRRIFPEATIYGCFFHFGQCLWRKIQALGLQTWYNERDNAFIIKQIQALAFVPPCDVCALFNKLMESFDEETDQILREFLQYFEAT